MLCAYTKNTADFDGLTMTYAQMKGGRKVAADIETQADTTARPDHMMASP